MDNKWISFQHYTSGEWITESFYCAALEFDGEDAATLKVWTTDGLYEYYNPVRNLQCETVES